MSESVTRCVNFKWPSLTIQAILILTGDIGGLLEGLLGFSWGSLGIHWELVWGLLVVHWDSMGVSLGSSSGLLGVHLGVHLGSFSDLLPIGGPLEVEAVAKNLLLD